MKYVILRCEDDARLGEQTAALLEGAKLSHLQQLAQAGAAGAIRHKRQLPIDRFHLHSAFFGLALDDPEAAPGRWYAASADVPLAEGERAWCCELITQRDGRIVDAAAGQIPTKESEVLIQGLNDQLGSATRRWVVGHNSHHLLITHEAALGLEGPLPVRSPELLVGRSWKRHLPKGTVGEALRSVIEQASGLLEDHPVNRVRVDLGENPANAIWLWGVGGGRPQRTFTDRTRLSGVIISNRFPMRGFARSMGVDWKEGPASLEEGPLQRQRKALAELIKRYDLIYVHLRIDTADPVERLCAMERIDQILLKPMTDALPAHGPWRLLAAIDDRRHRAVPFVAIGSDLPQQPIAHLNAQSFAESPLAFTDGAGLFSWFTKR